MEALLPEHLAESSKWRAVQVRERLVPAARKMLELEELTPSLGVYDRLLERPVSHGG